MTTTLRDLWRRALLWRALAASTWLAMLALLLPLGGCDLLPPVPPAAEPPPAKEVWLEQGWSAEQRQWFHHASQGTATLPVTYDWFVALEQPTISFFEAPLFSDPTYLRRWGFITSPKSAANPGGLPVGFALTEGFADPTTPEARPKRAIGLTCAACHTGHFTHNGVHVRVDGGPSMANVTDMGRALGAAVVFTKYIPGRFDRFARRVLGANYTEANAAALKAEFNANFNTLKHLAALDAKWKKQNVHEGFARLDALTRIGNQVFGVAAKKDANYVAISAPVSYPHIWSTSWFNWVQYDGSIMQPMVRNAGEALGVQAGVNLAGPAATRFASTADLRNLHRIEMQISGADKPQNHPQVKKAFPGLQSPKWPEDILGKIDAAQAARGKALYVQHCQGCHLPPPDGPDSALWSDAHWITLGGSPQKYLKTAMIPQKHVGTDPAQIASLNARTIDTTGIGVNARLWVPDGSSGDCKLAEQATTDGPQVPYGYALGAVVQQAIAHWYAQNKVPPEEQAVMNGGGRPNCLNPFDGYRPRPLNGVWATGPFLHNASVPTLYALLSPVSERPPVIWLGNREFDAKDVGVKWGRFEGGSEVNTSQPANSNAGHEFRDAPQGTPGVIGPLLKPDERRALIEYLKTL
jgi:mono/diheme cytochrome c family protein